MSAAKQLLDHKLLRTLSPLCDLPPDMLAELSGKSRVEQVVAGATVFTAGERDHRTLYLVAGTLELTNASGRSTKLKANTKQARQPLDPDKPHSVTAVAKTAVSLLNIDTGLLEMLLGWGNKQTYEVSNIEVEEEEEDTDWMSRFLQSKVFLKLRAENIQSMLMRMEEIKVRANDIVINQDDVDDNYYIIAKGRAKVARRVVPGAPLMKLAILTAGTGFGEEALIGNSKRNASVTMMEDGTLMRLAKADFISLLVEPILQYVSLEQAQGMRGPDVQWLDVRKLDEFSRGSLPGAKNIPLAELRLSIRKLNKLHKYIIFSRKGDRAAAAVFLLNQQGLEAFVLEKGLDAIPKASLEKKKAGKEPVTPAAPAAKVPTLKAAANFVDKAVNKVVNLRGDSVADTPNDTPENDGRVEALMSKAKQRVQQEMQRTQAAENARKQAQEEVARLKAEADIARQQVETEAGRAADKARSEAERASAQKRADELAEQQTERAAAMQRVQVEAARAEHAEAAREAAESEIERIKQETTIARREMEEQGRRAAENAKKDAEGEIIRLKAEAEVARQRVEEQSKMAADAARSEAERESAQKRSAEVNRHQQEAESALQKAEIEAMRAQQAESARQQAEDEAERMRAKAEETQREMEEQARLAADQARSEAERDAARQRAEYLAEKQEEIEDAVGKAEREGARAQAAESEVERLKGQAEEARLQAEEQAHLAVDAARSQVEREMAGQRAEEMARLQVEREEVLRRAEGEGLRAKAAEDARQRAEGEIQRLKVDAEVARMQLEEQAQRVADAARSDADREATRAVASEEARLQAVNELERLEVETEQIRVEAEEQVRLAADAARSEAERQAAWLRAEELALQKEQLEEIALRAEEESARATLADEARQRAENEIARRRSEAEEAEQRAAAEGERAQQAETARQNMEQEMAQLRAEAAAAREQVEKQARLFATAQRLEAEESKKDQVVAEGAERQRREAEAEVARQKQEADELEKREHLAAEVTARRKKQADDAARAAKEEADRAQEVADIMRREAEEEIKRLQAQAEASRLQAELEVKRSIAASRREVDKNKVKQAAQTKARKAVAANKSKNIDAEKAKRTREARAAAMRAIGKSEDGLDDDLDELIDLDGLAAEAADDAIIVNEAQIKQRAMDRDNLIDPTEVLKVEKQEQKRQWVSDDFIWEATLGYRDDPDVDSVGTPADSVGVEKTEAKKAKPKKSTEKKDQASSSKAQSSTKSSMFETQDINRTIRPQLDVPDRRHKRTFGMGAVMGAGLFLIIIGGSGWYFMSGDEAAIQLGKAVGKGTETLSNITDKVSETIGGLGGDDEAEVAASKQVDEEAMARLRERLQSMKATNDAKAEAKAKLERAEQAAGSQRELTQEQVVVEEGVESGAMDSEASIAAEQNVPEEVPLETVEDVMNALAAPAEAEDNDTDPDEEIGSDEGVGTGEEGVVESVDSLPVIDEVSEPEAAIETAPESTEGDAAVTDSNEAEAPAEEGVSSEQTTEEDTP